MDGPIEAPLLLEAHLEESVSDPQPGPLALGSEECLNRIYEVRGNPDTSIILLCQDNETGSVGFWTERHLPFAARPIIDIPGSIQLGGNQGLGQGVLLYEREGALSWTTSAKTAEGIASSRSRSWLFFGHIALLPGEVDKQLAAGQWTLRPGGWPLPNPSP